MAISVVWDNYQQTAVRLILADEWTWQEFDAARQQVQAMCKAVPHQVKVMLDIRTTIVVTPKILAKLHTMDSLKEKQKSIDTIISKQLKLQSHLQTAPLKIPN